MVTDKNKEDIKFRQGGYHSISEALELVGTDLFGLEFSDEQRAYWDEVMKVTFYLDDILDQDKPKDERFDQFDQVLGVITTGKPNGTLSDDINDLLVKFHQTTMDLDPSLIESSQKNAHTIALLGERMRETKSTKFLAKAVLAEGRLTGRIVGASPKGTTKGDPTEFNKYLELGTASSNALDTVVDLKKDSKEGILALDPTIAHRVELFGRVLPSGLKSFARLKPSTTLKLARGIGDVIKESKK